MAQLKDTVINGNISITGSVDSEDINNKNINSQTLTSVNINATKLQTTGPIIGKTITSLGPITVNTAVDEAPFIINSPTMVPNLNADKIHGVEISSIVTRDSSGKIPYSDLPLSSASIPGISYSVSINSITSQTDDEIMNNPSYHVPYSIFKQFVGLKYSESTIISSMEYNNIWTKTNYNKLYVYNILDSETPDPIFKFNIEPITTNDMNTFIEFYVLINVMDILETPTISFTSVDIVTGYSNTILWEENSTLDLTTGSVNIIKFMKYSQQTPWYATVIGNNYITKYQ